MRIAIVGAGIMGCSLARLLANGGAEIRLYERQEWIGGLCADGLDEDGDFTPRYGPHVFHTKNPRVAAFAAAFGAWRSDYQHRVVSVLDDGRTVPVPINTTTLRLLDQDVAGAAAMLYEPYSQKQWGGHWEQMRESALARVRARSTAEDRYFPDDAFQGFPVNGYSAWMAEMIRSPRIVTRLGVSPDLEELSAAFDRVYWTARIDEPLGFRFGALPFRTIDFRITRQHPVENLPGPGTGPVRRTHVGLLLGTGKPAKVIEEYPRECGKEDVPTHVVISPESLLLWERYAKALPPNVYPVGRFAEMRYLDMDASIERAFAVFVEQCPF